MNEWIMVCIVCIVVVVYYEWIMKSFFSNGFLTRGCISKWGNINGDFFIVCWQVRRLCPVPLHLCQTKSSCCLSLTDFKSVSLYLFLSVTSFVFCFLFLVWKFISFLFFTVHNGLVERTHMGSSLSLWIQKRWHFLSC
jgi:hypothetical protein